MYSIFEQLARERSVTMKAIAEATGIPQSTFSDWKKGRYTPKHDKMQKIADFFGVSVDYLMTGDVHEVESTSGATYYLDDQTAQIAQELMERKDLRVLMDASRDLSPENAALVVDFVMRLKGTNPNG